jgi:hypothetical protein
MSQLIKNYKLQNTNYKKIPNYNVQNYKQKINQKLLQGVQGDGFLEKSPPGRRRQKEGGIDVIGFTGWYYIRTGEVQAVRAFVGYQYFTRRAKSMFL